MPPADPSPSPPLTPAIRSTLAAVRRWIRAYVWIEGFALLVALVGLSFWLGLAWDWMFEPAPATRRIALIAVACLALYVVYRYLLRRVFVPISDTSAAVLLERRFPKLQDHLLTTVDIQSSPGNAVSYHPQLLSETSQAADAAIADVRVSQLFNRGPLLRAVLAAAASVISIAALAIFSHDVFGFWLERIALSDQHWPRRVQLEVVGFPPDATGKRSHKLAQDDDFELLVHANTKDYKAPVQVEIRFRLADGRRGRDTMIRVGDATTSHSDFQLFRYEFKHVGGDMEFDVVGGDDRVRGLHLQVVDRPELYAIELECVYPEYLGRESRRLPVTGGMRIPEGTKIVLHASSTKPLTAARVHGAKDKQDIELPLGGERNQTLSWDYGVLNDDDVLTVSVTDSDGINSREPYRVSLAVVKDEVPQVAVRLAGISSAITPDAILPFTGKITDDYGLNRAWFEYQVDSGQPISKPLAGEPRGAAKLEKFDSFDTRAVDAASGKRLLELLPKQRLAISLKAADRYNLAQAAREGSSQLFTLDVVTAADLLALLERRELALRQRFESIYEKMTDTRNLLSRVESEDTKADSTSPPPSDAAAKDADNSQKPADNPAATAQRMLARRRLRVAGSLQNVMQAADEIRGVAEAFDDLGDEITNNRIDNPDLKSRLGEQIARPLHLIVNDDMLKLVDQLKAVEKLLENPTATAPELKKAIAQADQVLVSMRQVLDKMLELETYNEVVALLRGIITDQEEINRRTKERQKDKLKTLFDN